MQHNATHKKSDKSDTIKSHFAPPIEQKDWYVPNIDWTEEAKKLKDIYDNWIDDVDSVVSIYDNWLNESTIFNTKKSNQSEQK